MEDGIAIWIRQKHKWRFWDRRGWHRLPGPFSYWTACGLKIPMVPLALENFTQKPVVSFCCNDCLQEMVSEKL